MYVSQENMLVTVHSYLATIVQYIVIQQPSNTVWPCWGQYDAINAARALAWLFFFMNKPLLADTSLTLPTLPLVNIQHHLDLIAIHNLLYSNFLTDFLCEIGTSH